MKFTYEIRVKNCPICGSEVSYHKDDRFFIISCEKCKSNGINISVSHENLEEAVKIWNNRPLFDKMSENFRYLNDFFRFYSGELKDDSIIDNLQGHECYKLFSNVFYDSNKKTSGCLITKTGEILPCVVSHISAYKHYLNIDDSDIAHDTLDKAVFNGFIRVSFFGKCLISEFNKNKINSEQISALYKYIDSNKNSLLSNIRTWGLSSPNDKSSFYTSVFDYLNAILLINC